MDNLNPVTATPNAGTVIPICTAQALGAGGSSASVRLHGGWSRAQLYASASVATSILVQVSPDGVNWYILTEDKAGDGFTLLLSASSLFAARDLPGFVFDWVRVVSTAAATVTAGLMVMVQ